MGGNIELTEVVSWPQAIVAIFIIVSAVVVPQIVGLIQNGSIQRKQDAVQHQLSNNGGKTMKDVVDRIDRTLTAHIERSERLEEEVLERLGEIEDTVDEHHPRRNRHRR